MHNIDYLSLSRMICEKIKKAIKEYNREDVNFSIEVDGSKPTIRVVSLVTSYCLEEFGVAVEFLSKYEANKKHHSNAKYPNGDPGSVLMKVFGNERSYFIDIKSVKKPQHPSEPQLELELEEKEYYLLPKNSITAKSIIEHLVNSGKNPETKTIIYNHQRISNLLKVDKALVDYLRRSIISSMSLEFDVDLFTVYRNGNIERVDIRRSK